MVGRLEALSISEIAHYVQTSLVWRFYTCTYGCKQIIQIFLALLTEKYCQVNIAKGVTPTSESPAALRCLSTNTRSHQQPPVHHPPRILGEKRTRKASRLCWNISLVPRNRWVADFLCQTLDLPGEPSLHKFLSSFLNTLHFWPLQQHVPINPTVLLWALWKTEISVFCLYLLFIQDAGIAAESKTGEVKSQVSKSRWASPAFHLLQHQLLSIPE